MPGVQVQLGLNADLLDDKHGRDYLTKAEHASGGGGSSSAHHAPVTLAVGSNALLTLTGQQLALLDGASGRFISLDGYLVTALHGLITALQAYDTFNGVLGAFPVRYGIGQPKGPAYSYFDPFGPIDGGTF